MKQLRKIVLLFLAAATLACGGARDRQTDINDATQYFSLLAQTLVQFFQNDLTTCENFLKIYDQLSTDAFDCDNGSEGRFNLVKNSVSCAGGSPLVATADFTLEFDNCADDPNDVTLTGPLSFALNFTRSQIFVLVTTPNVVVNGLNFFTDNMDIEIRFSSGNVNCDGNLTVDGDQCGIRSNCESCK